MISFLKPYKIIKIPGKSSFEDLTIQEVGLMIEADPSICENDGNDYFSSVALDEFLHFRNLKRPDLVKIRDRILQEIYIDIPGSKNKEINTDFLVKIAQELKNE
jgi:hypothetical protein